MRIIELIEDDENYYIVSEVLKGGELFQRSQAPLVAFDRYHPGGPLGQEGAGQPAGPWADLDGRALAEIAGVVPPPDEWPPGCRFHSRCPVRLDHCAAEAAPLVELSPTHTAWCHVRAREAGA